MHRRLAWTVATVLTVSLVGADTATAQQTVNFSLGYFAVRGEDGRVADDVLVENRETFVFDFKDFNTVSLGAEWLVPLGEYFEVGGGIGFTSRTVPTLYDNFVRPDGTEIEQEIKLRIVPITATARVLLLGRHGVVQPYVGGGVGIYNWRYSESGDFIDFSTPARRIFRDQFVAQGTSVGPVAVFGARFPLGRMSIGGEIRYQKADGDLESTDFFGSKIDLGGFHFSATFGVRF